MSITPVTTQDIFNQVEQKPVIWNESLNFLIEKFAEASQNLLKMKSDSTLGYNSETHKFEPIDIQTRLTELEIVTQHREHLIKEFVKQAMTGEDQEKIDAVSNRLLSKIHYAENHPKFSIPTPDFLTERLEKFLDKLDQHIPKTETVIAPKEMPTEKSISNLSKMMTALNQPEIKYGLLCLAASASLAGLTILSGEVFGYQFAPSTGFCLAAGLFLSSAIRANARNSHPASYIALAAGIGGLVGSKPLLDYFLSLHPYASNTIEQMLSAGPQDALVLVDAAKNFCEIPLRPQLIQAGLFTCKALPLGLETVIHKFAIPAITTSTVLGAIGGWCKRQSDKLVHLTE